VSGKAVTVVCDLETTNILVNEEEARAH
jgi:hypothetical protein